MSTFDVIIPCYNYGRYLPDCVASVLGQEGVEVRALVIDDASSDDSAEVAGRLAGQDPRLEFRRHAENRGHIATYNEGLEWAKSEYLLLISADDLVAPGALRRAARELDAHANVGLVYGRQVSFVGSPPSVAASANGDCACRVSRGNDFIASCCAAGHNPVATPTAVVRTAVQKAVGGYRPELPHTADLEIWLRIAARSDIAVIEADQALKRAHDQNMQRGFLSRTLGDLKQREAAFAFFFQDWGARVPDAGTLWRSAKRALADSAFWDASGAFDRGDTAACRRLLCYARTLDPELPTRTQWSRLQRKRRIGQAIWKTLRPLVNFLRPDSRICHSLQDDFRSYYR